MGKHKGFDQLLEVMNQLERTAGNALLKKIRKMEADYQKQIHKEIKKAFQLKVDHQKGISKLVTDFRKKHLRDLVRLAPLNRRFYSSTINYPIDEALGKLDVPLPFDDGVPLDPSQIAEIREKIAIAIFKMQQQLPGEITPQSTKPDILSCPSTMQVGEDYVLGGCRFGDVQGRIYIVGSPGPFVIDDIRILSWTDTEIIFHLNDTISGVGFANQGNLYAERPDGECGTFFHVNVIPISQVYVAISKYSDSGSYRYDTGIPKFGKQYSENKVLYSPVLPSEFEIWTSSYLYYGTILRCQTNSIGTYLGLVADGAEQAEYIGVPFDTYSPRKIGVNVVVRDGWYWDYTVSVEFYILVPQGFSVTEGWDSLASLYE